jgi:hypothetical protein
MYDDENINYFCCSLVHAQTGRAACLLACEFKKLKVFPENSSGCNDS